jgi:hypothetical protein
VRLPEKEEGVKSLAVKTKSGNKQPDVKPTSADSDMSEAEDADDNDDEELDDESGNNGESGEEDMDEEGSYVQSFDDDDEEDGDDDDDSDSDPYGSDDSEDGEKKKKKNNKKKGKKQNREFKQVPPDAYLIRREASLLHMCLKSFKKRVIVFFNEKV